MTESRITNRLSTATQPEDYDDRPTNSPHTAVQGLIYKADLAYQPDGRLAVDAYAD